MENYFELLKTEDEKIQLLRGKMKLLEQEEAQNRQIYQKIYDDYLKALMAFDKLNKSSKENYDRANVKSVMIITIFIAVIFLMLTFNFNFPSLLYLIIPLSSLLSEVICLNILLILKIKYQRYRQIHKSALTESNTILKNLFYAKERQSNLIYQITSQKKEVYYELMATIKKRDTLREIILTEFYPLLIETFNEDNQKDKESYQDIVKRVRTNISKAYPSE